MRYTKTKKCLCGVIIVIKSGHEKRCSKCQKKYTKQYLINYHKKHKKKIRGQMKKASKKWLLKNPEKALEVQRNYRKRNLELCRERGRKCQLELNNKKRFGGLRFKVLERDKYKCQKCGKDITGRYMACIHHVNKNRSDNRIENLISYCKSCHSNYHYGLKKYQF